MDELTADFVAEAGATLAQIESDFALLTSEGAEGQALLRVARALHTIKGPCGFMKFARTAALAHASEGALIRRRDGRAAPETRELVQAAVGEIKAILGDLAATGIEPAGDDHTLLAALAAMPSTLDWAAELTAIRDKLITRTSRAAPFPVAPTDLPAPAPSAPIDTAWRTLPLLVEELAATLDKRLTLSLEGGDVEAPRVAIAPLRNALGHLVRNCAVHGIEPAAERAGLGKDESGTIRLAASRIEDRIVITLRDDGRGLDTQRIRNRAISSGLVFAAHAARLDADQIHAFVFAPGLSTDEAATTLSGRGIGLDAVRAAIEGLGGAVTLHSAPSAGTVFTLTIPAEIAARSEPNEEELRTAALAHVA